VAFGIVLSLCSNSNSPVSSNTQYQLERVAQIQTDRQLLTPKILRPPCRSSANLLHCRSPLSLALRARR
jgi:hypothetical protein